MNDLAMALVRLTKHNRDGAFATQANRRRGLVAIANELYGHGFKLPHARSLKPKHIQKLVTDWQHAGLSTGTIKNRLGWLRWWAAKVNKTSILPRTNAELGLPTRRSGQTDRAQAVNQLAKLTDPRMQAALEAMQHFGLRLEEALKLRPTLADQKAELVLKGSWTKGGRPRSIPIRTAAQRALLTRLHQLANTGSMIPAELSYIHYRKRFEAELIKKGIKNVHGLRHAYAQQRYFELTGRPCPLASGQPAANLTPSEQQQDRRARWMISHELGHARLSITRVYLG